MKAPSKVDCIMQSGAKNVMLHASFDEKKTPGSFITKAVPFTQMPLMWVSEAWTSELCKGSTTQMNEYTVHNQKHGTMSTIDIYSIRVLCRSTAKNV